MTAHLESVVVSRNSDGHWTALHVPSGKKTTGDSPQDAQEAMRILIGINEQGDFDEPLTSDRFTGVARDIAVFLEGEVSQMLEIHSGFARLEAFDAAVAHIRLGGGCQGCPSSLMTLINGVRTQLQEKFGEDQVADVAPVL